MTGTVGWLDGILLMKLLSTKNRCATLLYNVQCTYFGEYAHMGWTAGGGRLEYCTCRDGGEGVFFLFFTMFTNIICIGRKARGGGGVDYKRRWCDIGRLF